MVMPPVQVLVLAGKPTDCRRFKPRNRQAHGQSPAAQRALCRPMVGM